MPPNIVLITADDMNWNAVGVYGCPIAGTTPNIDLRDALSVHEFDDPAEDDSLGYELERTDWQGMSSL